MAVDEPSVLQANLEGVGLLAADTFDADLLVRVLTENPAMKGLLWTAEPLQRSLRYVQDMPQISNICGRANFDSPPRARELLMVARRLLEPQMPTETFVDFLDWGFTGFEERVASTVQRDATVARVHRFVTRLGASNRVGEMLGEVAHELLMNAMFDAPINEHGAPKYAADRKARLTLMDAEQPTFRIASDGSRLVLQVIDPFGGLQRKHVFHGLLRALGRGELDSSHGGAGLGLAMCHNATVALFFDVLPRKRTTITGIFDLDLSLREFRSRAKSLHFFAG